MVDNQSDTPPNKIKEMKRKDYISPAIEIYALAVEAGFALSGGSGSGEYGDFGDLHSEEYDDYGDPYLKK